PSHYNGQLGRRGVAQPGRALRSGRRSRRFKSCLPDQPKHTGTGPWPVFFCLHVALSPRPGPDTVVALSLEVVLMSAGALRVRGKYLSGPGLSPGFLAGCLLALALLLGGAAHAGDPFDDARYAIGIKDNATALRLIDSGQFDVNMQNAEGYTLLSFAAGDGNLAMVQALLDRGADPGVRNSLGMTAQDRAVGTMVAARLKQAMEARQAGVAAPAAPAGNGDFDVIRHAIGTRNNAQAIAELDEGIAIDMQHGEGYTLLRFAARAGNLGRVEELLTRGANP